MNLTFTNRNFFHQANSLARKIFLSLVFAFAGQQAFATDGIWKDVQSSAMTGSGKTYIVPEKFRALTFDLNALKSFLSQAPMEAENGNYRKDFYFSFPMPDGTSQKFYIVESPVMHPLLAAQFPDIKTYVGQGIDDPTATIRFDYTQFGFHAMVLSASGSFFIDPFFWMETTYYISYDKKDYLRTIPIPACATEGNNAIDNSLNTAPAVERNFEPNYNPIVQKSIGTQLRKYDLALACTGEYAATYGGTAAGALAGMVTSVNRVNGIYEREVAIRMVLIANNNLLVYTNSSTDPYTNNSGSTMLGQNQTNITSIIGSANYDFGHVFSTGGGGIAGLGVICNSTQKARGVTGLPQPIGDPFDVDYVAHEMGHQFGGNHTFNCETFSCQGNRANNAAYEPGSGSTIMAYAGICSPNDLQLHSDPIFASKSFDEITVYTMSGTGNSCATITATGNNAPIINAGANFVIPYSTPFKLTGTASDPDGDAITYDWEEYDLGPPGGWNAPTFNAPLFRVWNPVISPTRLFPRLASILTNTQVTPGEFKPNYARTMKFKLTCRDNRFAGGGVTNNDTPVQINVINTGTPFAITQPNVTGITYFSNTLQTITWNVGSTDVAPISTPNVNIYFSTDGGQTFPTVIAFNAPNTGSYQWLTPIITTTTARVWVEGAGNAFFDINDKNFAINGILNVKENDLNNTISIYPNPGNDMFNFAMDNTYFGSVMVHVYDKLGRLVSNQVINKTSKQLNTRLDLLNIESGIYTVDFIFSEQKTTKKFVKL